MPWQLTAALYVFFTSLRSIQNRIIGKNSIDLTLHALAISFVCVLIVGLGVAVNSWSLVNHQAALDNALRLVGGGTVFALLNYVTIKLFRYVPASVAVFISLFNTLSVLLVASIFTGENLSTRQWLGAAILFATIILIAMRVRMKNKKKNDKNIALGVGLALLGAVLFGPAIVNEKILIDSIGLETYVLYGWGLQAIMSFALVWVLQRRMKTVSYFTLPRKIKRDLFVYGGLLGLAGLSFVSTLNNSGSASISAISGTANVATTVFLAYFLLKERDHFMLKLCGIILAAAGLLLIFTS